MTGAGTPSARRVQVDLDTFERAMDEDGFAVLRSAVAPERAGALHAELLDAYHAARDEGRLFEGGGSVSGHLNCFPGERARGVYDELADRGVFDLVRAIRPDLADRPRVTLNFNLPGSVAQHYHSDGLYLDEFLIVNIALVDTTLENGAIDMLPGTHQRFYPFWRYALGREYRRSTRVPLARGDVVIRKSTVWHRGMPNHSAAPRPMMAVTFGETDGTGDPFAMNGGEILFFPNWYSTSRLGQLRERTFVVAPHLYSTYRFGRSLVGKKGYASW